MTQVQGRRPATRRASPRVLDAVGLLLRLGLAGVLGYAGWTKITDLTGSVQNVVAYQLFPYELARAIGVLLPVVELALAALLLVGLLTRVSALLAALLMVAFIAGIASAWARGLAIDCGCFGTGGPVAPEDTRYLAEMVRDTGFLAMALWLAVRPRTLASLDTTVRKGS
ncbi:Conserved membrane protein [Serinicoccus hydrothermalis]|uniref:Conserved membrane protein n=1 Tax=Serinicoccus hydrothermalis TaxID=1758689 RepID=A0A1B1N865_9MICO|nr:MauE/DoxX family redox-associated membrane protein [Serinicoccus hydrothermalis]ANS77617.1 Conserved membrane protein [Serinicoccus hydrothermalis]